MTEVDIQVYLGKKILPPPQSWKSLVFKGSQNYYWMTSWSLFSAIIFSKISIWWSFLIPIWRRKWQPTPVFLPGEFHGQEPGGLQSTESQSRTRLSNSHSLTLIPIHNKSQGHNVRSHELLRDTTWVRTQHKLLKEGCLAWETKIEEFPGSEFPFYFILIYPI